MKPKNVDIHDHHFAYDWDDPRLDEDDINGRYDSYRTTTGECGVWSPATDKHWVTKSWAEAQRTAKAMAEEYRAHHP